MKKPTAASLKKVSASNLARLGAERLADILAEAAEVRPELKRRLRMELAAAQGAEHLVVEIDKRLAALGASRSKVSWRQRPTFVRDLDGLRKLIAIRLSSLDRSAALDRMWAFMDVARQVGLRVKDRDGELGAVFGRGAEDIGTLIGTSSEAWLAESLIDAVLKNPRQWLEWLPAVLGEGRPEIAKAALRRISEGSSASGLTMIVRELADAAGDVDSFRATFSASLLKTPLAASQVGARLLKADRIEEAGAVLDAARPQKLSHSSDDPDFAWESVFIDYLERSNTPDAAQALRWVSFERTLSIDRAKAFIRPLNDFEDVEAEDRVFHIAARHPDFHRGLQVLIEWPALARAGRMIEARADDIQVSESEAELWAARLRGRYPRAAYLLLRKAAASAFRRRDYATCNRLTHEADEINAGLPDL